MSTEPARRATPVVWSLALVWVLVHVVALVLTGHVSHPSGMWLLWGAPSQDVLLRLGAARPALVEMGDWQRQITYAFLHGFVLHLLLNTWVFFAVGRLLESVIGSSRLWIVFVVSALAGALASQALAQDAAEKLAVMVGASGGVFGAVGALGVWAYRSDHPAARAARGTVLMFLVISAFLFFLPNVAHLAHLGGLVGGAVVMAALGPNRSLQPADGPVKGVAVLCLLLVGAAGVVQAYAGGGGANAEFLQDLRDTEKIARGLYDRPDLAKPAKRQDLHRRLNGLLGDAEFMDDDAREAFGAYVEAWRPVADGNVPDPFAFQAALERAEAAWAPHRARLGLESASGR